MAADVMGCLIYESFPENYNIAITFRLISPKVFTFSDFRL